MPNRFMATTFGAVAWASVGLAPTGSAAQLALPESPIWSGNEINFCINAESVLVDLDRAVAQAVADALLLPAVIHELGSAENQDKYSYILPLAEMGLLLALTETCQVIVGWRLTSQGPSWVTVTQPYYSTRVALAVVGDPPPDVADIPPGATIASVLAGPGDLTFASYLASQPQGQRWRRLVLPSNEVVIDRLFEGSVAGAVLWEPGILAAIADAPDSKAVTVMAPPFQPTPVQFGMVMMTNEVYLRTVLDDGIAAVLADGIVPELTRQLGLPDPL